MRKYLFFPFLFSFLPFFTNWQGTFDDLFNEIIFDEIPNTDLLNNSSNQFHSSSFDFPKPIYSTYIKDWKTYLSIDWSIDKNVYFPIILITKDWQTYYSEKLWNDILLEQIWHYNVRAQARVDWEYVIVDETLIVNDNINFSEIWKPAAWPELLYIFLISLLFFALYYIIRLNLFNNKINNNEKN